MIIMLAGKRKSGKTEAALTFCYENPEFKVASFADFLRDEYSKLFNVPIYELIDNVKKEEHRENLITYADLLRKKDRYFIAKKLFSDLPDGDWIIDDLRCIEELEYGLKVGARPYMVYCQDNVRKFRGWKHNPAVDTSYLETEMDLSQDTYAALGGGYIYNNTNSLIDLRNRVHEVLRTVR